MQTKCKQWNVAPDQAKMFQKGYEDAVYDLYKEGEVAKVRYIPDRSDMYEKDNEVLILERDGEEIEYEVLMYISSNDVAAYQDWLKCAS
jgi:hypothetical protein